MGQSLFETVVMAVYDGFQGANMVLGLDPYGGDMIFSSAKQDTQTLLVIAGDFDLLTSTECCIPQASLEKREGQYCEVFKEKMVFHGHSQDLEGSIRNFLVAEAAFQKKLQELVESGVTPSDLFRQLRRRQTEILQPTSVEEAILA